MDHGDTAALRAPCRIAAIVRACAAPRICACASPSITDVLAPDVIGIGSVLAQRFRLDAVIGQGAMGTVYRAHDAALGHAVAVKVMHTQFLDDPTIVARFDREAISGSRLDHPNCARVLAAGTTASGQKFLVMPLYDGVELRKLIGRGMAVDACLDIVGQVLGGLAHAHARGFIHRDVKPENVLIVHESSGARIAKLVDFGLVKGVSIPGSAKPLTQVGRVFGTPWYMSPEQAAGQDIDVRTDLYAVGAMMFEMLTGQVPFDGESLTLVLHKQMFAEVPALPSWVPAPLVAFVRGLLAKEPSARPSSASEAATRLRSIAERMASLPTVAPARELAAPDVAVAQLGAHEARPTSMLQRRSPLGWLVGGVAAAAAALVLAIGLGHGGPELAPTIATAPVTTPIATTAVPVIAAPTSVSTPAPVVEIAHVAPSVDVVTTASPTIDRASGSEPVAATPPARPSPKPRPRPAVQPRRDPPRTELPAPPRPTPEPLPHLRPSKPVRGESKLPGAGTGTAPRTGGLLHLRPRGG